MSFSLRSLGMFIAWIAIVIALICQIRWEVMRFSWSSGVATDIVWAMNLFFALVVVLLAIATRSNQRIFWIGCAVVAVALFLCQATDRQPRSIARNISVPLMSWLIPADHEIPNSLKESHVMEMGAMLVFSVIPLLSLTGGAFARWVYQRTGPTESV